MFCMNKGKKGLWRKGKGGKKGAILPTGDCFIVGKKGEGGWKLCRLTPVWEEENTRLPKGEGRLAAFMRERRKEKRGG